jgi:hypothetical protein
LDVEHIEYLIGGQKISGAGLHGFDAHRHIAMPVIKMIGTRMPDLAGRRGYAIERPSSRTGGGVTGKKVNKDLLRRGVS